METVITIIIAIVVFVGYSIWKQKKEEKQLRINEIIGLVEKAHKAIEKIDEVKGIAAKVNNSSKALKYLYAASQFKEHKEVIHNYDELISRIKKLEKVFPVIGHLEKAAKYKYKGNDRSEKNALLDAMYEIETAQISDSDIIEADIQTDAYDETILIGDIQSRLKELGWESSGT